MRFYNTRDVPETLEGSFMGNPGLTNADENAIVACMLTLPANEIW